MWTYEHAVETTAAPRAVWRLWADVDTWSTWNPGVEKIDLRGPFAEGSEFTMHMPGQDPVELRLGTCVADEVFVDEAAIDGLVLRTEHRIEPGGPGRVRIVYRMEISGPGAERVAPEIGPAVTADWPETMASLVELAERG